MLRHSIYILMVTMYSLTLFGQGQANIFMDSTTFLIGDQVRMQVVVNVPLGNTIVFPIIEDILQEEELELVSELETELIKGDVNNTYKKELTITAWEPGNHLIPAMKFSYKSQGASESTILQSEPLNISVIAPQVTGDSTYVADIKPILAEQPNLWDKLLALLQHPIVIVLLLLMLAFVVFYAIMTLKNRPTFEAPITPEDLALQRLEALKEDKPLDRQDFKAYHTTISFILREYIKNRFRIAALEHPVNDFFPLVQKHRYMKATLVEEFKTVLDHADLIKFAKASPLDIANQKAMDFCYHLIQSVQERLEEETLEKTNAEK